MGTAVFDEPYVVHLALLVRLAPADGDEDPVAVARIDDVGPAKGAQLATPHPSHKQQPRDYRIETPALEGDLIGLDAPAAPPWPMAGGEHGREVRDPERPRLSSSPIGGGPPVPGQHPGRPLSGGSGLAGQLRAEARRGDRHRGARRGATGVVQLGEVGGQGDFLELRRVYFLTRCPTPGCTNFGELVLAELPQAIADPTLVSWIWKVG